ncbi:hypothetical protein JM83_0154 [Gillisia sp. Hel_I_86]|uniref:DUF2059 domain-containing protein n=1 Tax=Gillisia sp. Hel_I_86 TaxID=1249981 RepID=UPI00119A81D6|nr:DUF2059 domain-containing protein [Gillisia sp. Hel_I_86]TVZ25252.1 hypothetical protein JM83_0154 [Gillisia sp. Hel_I_86]
MKNTFYAVFFLFIGFTGFSQEADAAYKAKAVQLIEINSGATFDVMLKPLVGMVAEENRAAFKKDVEESMTNLFDQLAVVYMESFTEAELDQILDFYATPVGKKMTVELPVITEKSMQIGQMWGMKLQPLMAKYSK